jgi:hypothetical protein
MVGLFGYLHVSYLMTLSVSQTTYRAAQTHFNVQNLLKSYIGKLKIFVDNLVDGWTALK